MITRWWIDIRKENPNGAIRYPANQDNVGFELRGLELETVTSADGTSIAFEKSGDGPPVVIVGGGIDEKAMFANLADGIPQGQFVTMQSEGHLFNQQTGTPLLTEFFR